MMGVLSILGKYLIGLVGITVAVVVHELGHLVSAKLSGIDVEIFSFGLGPKLLSKLFKGTEYRLSLFPVGGYCRLKGSDDLSQALINKSKHFTHTEEGSLFSVHPAKRLVTYASGPLANLLFAVLLYAVLAALPTQRLSTQAFVATINDYPHIFGQSESPAYLAGIRTGDKILKVDAYDVEDWEGLQQYLSETKDAVQFTIQRGAQERKFEVSPVGGRFGLASIQLCIVGNVRPNTPESRAGLLPGDRILTANGQVVNNQLELLQALDNRLDEATLEIQRGSTKLNIVFQPNLNETGKADWNFSLEGQKVAIERSSFSLAQGGKTTLLMANQTLQSIRSLLGGKSVDIRSQVTGMARSALIIGDITSLGFEEDQRSGLHALFYLMGVVSISLAIANMLPLPAFDGGQMLLALFEWVSGKHVSPKTYWRLQLVGIVCVIAIFVFLGIADIRHFLALRR